MSLNGAQSRYYGPENPNLCCCCIRCHVLTGGKIVALLLMILYTINFCGSVVLFVAFENPVSFIVAVCALVVIGLLWYGLSKENDNCMIPFIVCLIVYIVIWAVATIIVTIAVPILIAEDWHRAQNDISVDFPTNLETFTDTLKDSNKVLIALILLVVIANLTLLINFWIFYIIIRSYQFIKSKNDGQGIMMVSLTHAPTNV